MLRLRVVFLLVLPVVCLAALDASKYSRSQQLHEDYMLRWQIENDVLKIGVEVQAVGWVGFGITEAGGMKGADIVYIEAASGDIVDAHSLSYSKPETDTCQDWTLATFSKEEGKLVFEASRQLRTGDNEDWEIVNDVETMEGHAFIAAWGDSEEISYHASNRVSGRVFLFGEAREDRILAVRAQPGIEQSDILHDENLIPATETYYAENCINLEQATGLDPDVPRHIVAHEAIIDPGTAQYVHHFLVYGYAKRDCKDGGGLVMSWAPGRMAVTMPPEAGIRIFGDGGYKSFHIQTHYNNPNGDSGMRDSSGFRLLHTTSLRAHDIGVIQIGDPLLFLGLGGAQLARGWSQHAFECEGLTDEFAAPEVRVYMRFLHMHAKGERMVTRQLRGGAVVRTDSAEVYDFDQSGGLDPLSTGAGWTIRKGDSFEVDCYYHTGEGRGRTEFGLGSDDEMCIDYLFYYPRQPLDMQGSCAVLFGDGEYLGETFLSSAEEAGRTFGLACNGTEPPAEPETGAGVRERGSWLAIASAMLLVVIRGQAPSL